MYKAIHYFKVPHIRKRFSRSPWHGPLFLGMPPTRTFPWIYCKPDFNKAAPLDCSKSANVIVRAGAGDLWDVTATKIMKNKVPSRSQKSSALWPRAPFLIHFPAHTTTHSLDLPHDLPVTPRSRQLAPSKVDCRSSIPRRGSGGGRIFPRHPAARDS